MSKVILDDTGERMVPEHHKGRNIYGAHIGRYEAGVSVVKDKIVLDIASGSGYGTKIMAKEAQYVYGVDVDEQAIAYAQENYSARNIKYLQGDGVSIPLDDNTIEVVVSYETIEHIENYEQFMSEVKRVLKPGGILLLSTPNDIEYAEGNHYHVHEFEYEELKLMVKKYFQHHTDYFQTLWMYSTILPLEMQISEWQKNIKTLSTVTLKPEQSIYFFMLCSDAKITATIEPQGVIGEHFRQRDLQRRNEERRKLQNEVKQLKENRQELRLHQVKLERQISEIHESKAWEFTRYLQKISKYLRLPFPK